MPPLNIQGLYNTQSVRAYVADNYTRTYAGEVSAVECGVMFVSEAIRAPGIVELLSLHKLDVASFEGAGVV